MVNVADGLQRSKRVVCFCGYQEGDLVHSQVVGTDAFRQRCREVIFNRALFSIHLDGRSSQKRFLGSRIFEYQGNRVVSLMQVTGPKTTHRATSDNVPVGR